MYGMWLKISLLMPSKDIVLDSRKDYKIDGRLHNRTD